MEYEIIHSKRRTLCLQIKRNGSVIVRAPFKTSERVIDDFVNKHTDWINKKLISVKSKKEYEATDKETVEKLKRQAKEFILPRVSYFSKIMGVFPERVSINSAKTRFGSCSSKKSLNFSYRLVFYPPEAIDYVCVHELAHLTEMNHSKKFWAIVEKYLPDYKERKKLLK
ncbi:MAG: M48 family metallopeptidase [Clostridia bacterium]|nr:M48 family metallopeptidase [Clostridia bacterium]